MAYTGKRKNRFSYLNEYAAGVDGSYIYTGAYYVLEGGAKKRKNVNITLIISCVLFAALFILAGCTNVGGDFMAGKFFWNTWFIIIPYALLAVGIFLFIWRAVKLLLEKEPVKKYVYEKSVPWLGPVSMFIFIFALADIAVSFVYLGVVGSYTSLAALILYMAINLFMAALAFVFNKFFKKNTWTESPVKPDVAVDVE